MWAVFRLRMIGLMYRYWTERKLLQEIAELKAEINRLREARRTA
jgi:hypothetical protein